MTCPATAAMNCAEAGARSAEIAWRWTAMRSTGALAPASEASTRSVAPRKNVRTTDTSSCSLLGAIAYSVDNELRPAAAEFEAAGRFPCQVFRTLGRAGLLSLPYPEQVGGGGQTYEVYVQALEEIASASASVGVGVGVGVHALSCFGLFTAGTDEQKQQWLPQMLSGERLGAYCLSPRRTPAPTPPRCAPGRCAAATSTC
jgi:hypothetical protein